MSDKVLLGRSAKVYRNTAVSGDPTWNEITVVQDAARNSERAEVDATTRGDGDEQVSVVVQKKRTVEFTLRAHLTDAGFLALQTAHEAGTPIRLLVMNGPNNVTGTKGVDRDWYVRTWNESQPIAGIVTVQVSLAPAADGSTTPAVVTGASA